MNDIEIYIYNNYQSKTSKQLSEELNLSFDTIKNIIRKLKLKKQTKKELIYNYIISLQDKNININELSKKFNISISQCYRSIKGLNLITTHPLYNTDYINHNYFSQENLFKNPDRFVIIGFITADGCLSYRKTSKSLIFNLSKKDNIILNILNRELANNTRKIYDQNKTNSIYISFPSNQICEDLNFYNITPQKTSIITFPKNITNENLKYYLRGLFYGDGNIYISKNRKRYSLICNNIFGNDLKYFSDKNISYCCMSELKNNPGFCQLVWQGKHADEYEKFIFNDEKMILLPRKHKHLYQR